MDNAVQKTSAPIEKEERHFFDQLPSSLGEVDLRELFRKLWRRKGIIFSTTIFVTILTTIIIFQMVNLYTSSTYVLIEPREANVVNLEAVLSGLGGDVETIQSEIEVIQSRQLINKLVEKLKFDRNPEFNESLRPKGSFEEFFNPMNYIPEEWLNALRGGTANGGFSEEELQIQERAKIIDIVLDNIEVSIKGRSRVISISFTSESPKLAALTPNTLADFYIVEQLEAKFEATQRASKWLQKRVTKLRNKVQYSERAVEVFRKESGLLAGFLGTLTSQQVSELNTQLILARTARAEADARLLQVQELVSSAGGGETAGEVLDSPLIQRLREQEAQVQRKAAKLSEEYGRRHPKIINIRAEAQDIKNKIKQEVAKIIKGLENEVGIAKAREISLKKSMEKLKVRVSQANTKEVQLRALEREATANRALFETFLSRFKETSAQEDISIQRADARIISFASIPDNPSFPKIPLIIALVLVGSTFLGLMLAFVVEQLDRGFRSGEQIEKAIGVSPLGLVPLLGRSIRKGSAPEQYLLQRPTSSFTESMRSLHTSLHISSPDNPPKKILVTSSLPGEGKTVISICLARMLAKAGHSVIFLDLDLRKPSIAKNLRLKEEPGISNILTGQTAFADAVQEDKISGVHIVTAGTFFYDPPDLINNKNMDKLLDLLDKKYEYIIMDSPPVLAVSDSRLISRKADITLFAVKWAETHREVVIQGIKLIQESQGKLPGIVLSQVDVKKHARYGYGDSGYYYGRAKKYYTD